MDIDITANIPKYLEERKPDLRYASFDFCYNYFQSFYENNKLEELSSKIIYN
jgi:hypothetical protein